MNKFLRLIPSQPLENRLRKETVRTFVGVMEAKELVERYRIPYRDFDKDEGYQRHPTTSRVKKLAKDLEGKQVDIPTSMLLSVRDRSHLPTLENNGTYTLELPPNGGVVFYVIDGQHRLEALKKVIEDNKGAGWEEYKIPVVILFGADNYAEMEQFYVINSNAKKITPNLALDLLQKRAMSDDRFSKYLQSSSEDWKVLAHELTREISYKDVWRNRIRFSTQPKAKTTVASNAFVASLKRAFGQDSFSTYPQNERIDIIIAYWEGIRQALPECFAQPDQYNIQKSLGVRIFHELLPLVISYATRHGCPVTAPATYFNIIGKTLQELQGENTVGGESVGHDFWRVGAEGVSGAYASNAGKRLLHSMIKRDLEENLRIDSTAQAAI